MSGEEHKELLELIDLLCEGAASPQQCARLEQLVLTDAQAREVYLDQLEIHGLLTWDVGGAAISPVPRTLPQFAETGRERATAGSSRRRRILPAMLASAIVLVASAVVVSLGLRQRDRPLVTQDSPPAASSDGQGPIPIEEVALPRLPAVDHDSAVQRQPDQPEVAVPASGLLADYSDETVITFIDGQIRAGWNDYGISPSPRADDAEWVRRVYLDLLGRIPTAKEATAFLTRSTSDEDARTIGALLSDNEHSRHLATQWLNLLIGRSPQRGVDRSALFAYLVNEFQENQPWTRTVEDLLTASGGESDNGAATFLLAHLNNQAVPATAIAARLFLGEQLQCVQCHTHPLVKDWGQERFWEFNAFFQQCRVVSRTVVDQETGERFRYRELVDRNIGGPTYYETLQGVMKVTYPKFGGVEIDPSPEVNRRQELARLMCSGDQPQLARAFVNRVWGQLFGHALTPFVDDLGPHHASSHPELLSGLTEAFIGSGYDVGRLLRWICLSQPYRLTSKQSEGNEIDDPDSGETPLFSRMYLKPLSVEQLHDSLLVAMGKDPIRLHPDELDADREAFVHQFFTSLDTEENNDATTFDGSLPQALLMMNGPEMQAALAGQDSPLAAILSSQHPQPEKIRRLCLATLSRYPTSEELATLQLLLRRQVKTRTDRGIPARVAVSEALTDLYWAYLNSSEFSVNH